MKKSALTKLIKECHNEILKEEIDETKLTTALKANKIRINLLM